MGNIKKKLEKPFSLDFWEDVLAAILRPLVLLFLKINQFRKNNPRRFRKIFFGMITALIFVAVGLGLYRYQKYQKENPFGVWEILIVLRSQEGAASPEEDAKNNLKRGDVIAVREEKHAWSRAEYKSYLLVKIEGRKQEAEKLLEPLEKETGEKDEQGQPKKELVRLRRFAVDMDKIGFSGDQVVSGQPLENQVFQAKEVIREK